MTPALFRPGDPAEYWQMEGESDGYRAIAARWLIAGLLGAVAMIWRLKP